MQEKNFAKKFIGDYCWAAIIPSVWFSRVLNKIWTKMLTSELKGTCRAQTCQPSRVCWCCNCRQQVQRKIHSVLASHNSQRGQSQEKPVWRQPRILCWSRAVHALSSSMLVEAYSSCRRIKTIHPSNVPDASQLQYVLLRRPPKHQHASCVGIAAKYINCLLYMLTNHLPS